MCSLPVGLNFIILLFLPSPSSSHFLFFLFYRLHYLCLILLRPCLFSSHLGHSFPSLIFIAPYHELLYFSFHYLVSPLSHNSFFSLFLESLSFLLFLVLLVLLQLLRAFFFLSLFIFLFVATLTFPFLRCSSVFLPSSTSIIYYFLFCHPDIF